MIRNGAPFCDVCRQELKAWTEEEALEAVPPCGWHDWKTAAVHYCHDCADRLMDQAGFPPCGICETHPCERGRDCWATPPLHLFPYETFFGETLFDNTYNNDFDLEEPIEDSVRNRQKMQIAAHIAGQQVLQATP